MATGPAPSLGRSFIEAGAPACFIPRIAVFSGRRRCDVGSRQQIGNGAHTVRDRLVVPDSVNSTHRPPGHGRVGEAHRALRPVRFPPDREDRVDGLRPPPPASVRGGRWMPIVCSPAGHEPLRPAGTMKGTGVRSPSVIAAAIVATAAGVVAIGVMLVGGATRLCGFVVAAAGATAGLRRLRHTRGQTNRTLLSSRLLDIHDCPPAWSWTPSARSSRRRGRHRPRSRLHPIPAGLDVRFECS